MNLNVSNHTQRPESLTFPLPENSNGHAGTFGHQLPARLRSAGQGQCIPVLVNQQESAGSVYRDDLVEDCRPGPNPGQGAHGGSPFFSQFLKIGQPFGQMKRLVFNHLMRFHQSPQGQSGWVKHHLAIEDASGSNPTRYAFESNQGLKS